MVSLSGLPAAARCPNEQEEKALRHLFVLWCADVHSRATRNRGLRKVGRAGIESRRTHPHRPTGTTLSAEMPRVWKTLLGQSRIAGNELVQHQSNRLPVPGEKLPGRRFDWGSGLTNVNRGSNREDRSGFDGGRAIEALVRFQSDDLQARRGLALGSRRSIRRNTPAEQ